MLQQRQGNQGHGAGRSRPYWSQVLRALREARGVTQEGWAMALGVGRTTVQSWERGSAAPDSFAEEAILTYCRAHGMFRRFEQGPLKGLTLTPESLSSTLAEARHFHLADGALHA